MFFVGGVPCLFRFLCFVAFVPPLLAFPALVPWVRGFRFLFFALVSRPWVLAGCLWVALRALTRSFGLLWLPLGCRSFGWLALGAVLLLLARFVLSRRWLRLVVCWCRFRVGLVLRGCFLRPVLALASVGLVRGRGLRWPWRWGWVFPVACGFRLGCLCLLLGGLWRLVAVGGCLGSSSGGRLLPFFSEQ